MIMRERWLHGWPRIGLTGVLIGTGVHCVGCGQFQGITSVAFDGSLRERIQFRRRRPSWPFPENDCPVHLTTVDADDASWPRGKPRPLP